LRLAVEEFLRATSLLELSKGSVRSRSLPEQKAERASDSAAQQRYGDPSSTKFSDWHGLPYSGSGYAATGGRRSGRMACASARGATAPCEVAARAGHSGARADRGA